MCLQYKSFLKHCWKRRNCLEWAISPFLAVVSTRLETFLQFSSNLKLLSASSFNFEESNICRLGKGQWRSPGFCCLVKTWMVTQDIFVWLIISFPNDKFWTLWNSKSLQMTILNVMKMAESSLKRVENTLGKGEIACYEQILLFQQGF